LSTPKISEAELAIELVQWLESYGWETYKEVPVSWGYADIIAVRGGIYWLIEVKTRLSDDLIAQAKTRNGLVHLTSIACPLPNRGVRIADDFYLRYHGIGLLSIGSSGKWNKKLSVREIISPKFARPSPEKRQKLKKNMAYLKDRLLPEYKAEAAGVAASERLSPFKATCIMVKRHLEKNGPLTSKELAKAINHHYGTDRSFCNQLHKLYHLIDGVEYVNKKFQIKSQNEAP